MHCNASATCTLWPVREYSLATCGELHRCRSTSEVVQRLVDNFHLLNGDELVIILTPTSTTKFSYDDCYQVFPFCKDHWVEVRLAPGVMPEGQH